MWSRWGKLHHKEIPRKGQKKVWVTKERRRERREEGKVGRKEEKVKRELEGLERGKASGRNKPDRTKPRPDIDWLRKLRCRHAALHTPLSIHTQKHSYTDIEHSPWSFLRTATSILRTCFGCLADSSLRATCSRVTRSCPS